MIAGMVAACSDSDNPGVCGAVLGEPCGDGCDLGLSCEQGTCACTASTCALACSSGIEGGASELVVDGDLLFYSAFAYPNNWELVSANIEDGTRMPLASGSAAQIKIATFANNLYVLENAIDGSSSEITRRSFDGSNMTTLGTALPDAHSIAVSDRGVAYGQDSAIRLIDSTNQTVTLAQGPQVDFPIGLTFDGATDMYWINHFASPQSVMVLSGTTASPIMTGPQIDTLAVCPDAIYWSLPFDSIRFSRQDRTFESLGEWSDEMACDGTQLYWLGPDPDAHGYAAIRTRTSTGELESVYRLPWGEDNPPEELALSSRYVLWTFYFQDTSQGPLVRIMRTQR